MASKKQALGLRTKAERRADRERVGALQDLIISKHTLTRYEDRLNNFFAWIATEGKRIPRSPSELEEEACTYLEHLWEDGAPRSHAGDYLSGLSHFMPRLKGQLTAAWRLHTAWSRNELPARAVPFDGRTALALAGRAIVRGWVGMAAGIALGFHCLLRTGELVGATFADVSLAADSGSGVLHLGLTKGGQRRGVVEQVTIVDPQVCMLLRLAGEDKPPAEPIIGVDGASFRRKFELLLMDLELQQEGYKPYSLMRGGCTHWFHQSGSMDRTMLRGRWASAATARIYIDDAARQLRLLRLEDRAKLKIAEAFNVYKSLFRGDECL